MTERSRGVVGRTVGLDVGDKWSHYAVLDRAGEVIDRGRVGTRRQAMGEWLAQQPRSRVVLEVGAHSPWLSRLLSESGHEAIVANPRRVRLIFENRRKSDRLDAEQLARLGRVDPQLLHPVRHRGEAAQAARALLLSRDALVRSRTALIAHARGQVKAFGYRLKRCSAPSFARQASELLPEVVQESLSAVLETIEQLTLQIRSLESQIHERCRHRYPKTELLQQVGGVGQITALAFVVTLEDPRRFARSRDVGPFVGLVPRRAQSGARDPQLRITKEGDPFLRRLLVQSAHYILGPFGEDCDLRRFGEALIRRGGKAAKKRAVVAVARKLAVLLHHLWITAEVYEPLYNANRRHQDIAA